VVEHEGLPSVLPPDGPLPRADAVVAIGHVLNYLSNEAAVARALAAIAAALRPGSVLALDRASGGEFPAGLVTVVRAFRRTGRASP
jgi:O-methyltransferase involved in polyketide biosynthesis